MTQSCKQTNNKILNKKLQKMTKNNKKKKIKIIINNEQVIIRINNLIIKSTIFKNWLKKM